MIDDVLAYAAQGRRVGICHTIRNGWCTCGNPKCKSPGKHPFARLNPNGVTDATTDIATIREWWADFPDGNVSIATGPESDIVAIDIDPRHGGAKSWAELVARHGPLPETVKQRTGSNGTQWLFSWQASITNRAKIVSGVDVRGRQGYIMAPPSLHIEGRRYRWEEGHGLGEIELAVVPGWLRELVKRERSATKRETKTGCTVVKTGRLVPTYDSQRRGVVIA